MRQTIRHEGDNAKNKFRQLVTNVRRENDFSNGDTEVFIDGDWYHVDVKDCQSSSVNQVRAIRYQTLVIYKEGIWYVIPPQEVVRLVAQRSRGQHCAIPFESANVSLSQVKTVYRCSDSQLAERVYSAVRMGNNDNYLQIKKIMDELHDELMRLNEKSRFSVKELFGEN